MYRFRFVCTVQYGKYREVAEGVKRLCAVCAEKGWARPRFLMATTGPENEAVLEFEYPDLATLEAETRTSMTDQDFMKVWRSSTQYIYPQSARNEIYEDAFDIA